MIKHLTAYPITHSNAHVLGHITGLTEKMMRANVGWVAAYSETRKPRWQVFPKSFLGGSTNLYTLDEESYP